MRPQGQVFVDAALLSPTATSSSGSVVVSQIMACALTGSIADFEAAAKDPSSQLSRYSFGQVMDVLLAKLCLETPFVSPFPPPSRAFTMATIAALPYPSSAPRQGRVASEIIGKLGVFIDMLSSSATAPDPSSDDRWNVNSDQQPWPSMLDQVLSDTYANIKALPRRFVLASLLPPHTYDLLRNNLQSMSPSRSLDAIVGTSAQAVSHARHVGPRC